jgi:hypothetical protein
MTLDTTNILTISLSKMRVVNVLISLKSRILVELSNELFETSTNSVSRSKFIVKTSHETVKTSHETVKSNLFYVKSGINACEVPHN